MLKKTIMYSLSSFILTGLVGINLQAATITNNAQPQKTNVPKNAQSQSNDDEDDDDYDDEEDNNDDDNEDDDGDDEESNKNGNANSNNSSTQKVQPTKK